MSEPAPYEELRDQALAALEAGEPRDAFGRFRWVLEYPGEAVGDDARWREALDLFARIAQGISGEGIPGCIARVLAAPDDADAYYDLGYELIEYGLHGIAATVLARCVALAPGRERYLTELVAALERHGLHQEACGALRAAPGLLEDSFICRYLLAFNALMTGDVEVPRGLLPRLEVLEDQRTQGMAARIGAMLARADVAASAGALDGDDLRGWHYVICGGLQLHLSPFGFEGGMRGRYAWVQDTDALCLEGLRRLAAVRDAWGLELPRVFALADRRSEVLAEAAALVLDVSLEGWPADGTERPGLIVGYDLRSFEGDLRPLVEHRPGQVLFTQAESWTDDFPVAADLVTFCYQQNTAPWDAHVMVDPETREVRRGAADARPAETLARRVASAALEPDALADLATLEALARAVAGAGLGRIGCLRGSGRRCRRWSSSPVGSNRFL